MNQRPIITLLTDFGEHDAYVGAMKGVMLSIVPDVQLIDISHQVSPQDIRQAASLIASVYSYYPAHTIHLIVVDPGVGSERQPIALSTAHGIFVAPDNGVLTHVRSRESSSKAYLLNNPKYWLSAPSNTFHGRDIFSPVAAHLASGTEIKKMGALLDKIVMLNMIPLSIGPTSIRGEVVRIDHFGNALTNISGLTWLDSNTLKFDPPVENAGSQQRQLRIDARKSRINCGWHTLTGINESYSHVPAGQPVALVGSGGELELAINQGNAADVLAIRVGTAVTLLFS